MKITFLETRRLCENGFAVKQFEAGKTYDVMDTTARAAIANGWAREPHCLGDSDALKVINSFLFEPRALTNPDTYAAKGEAL